MLGGFEAPLAVPAPSHCYGGGGSLLEEGSRGGLGGAETAAIPWIYLRKRLLILSHTELTLSARLGGWGAPKQKHRESARPPRPAGTPPQCGGLGGDPRPPSVLWGTPPTPPESTQGWEKIFKGFFLGGICGFWGFLGRSFGDLLGFFVGFFAGFFGGFFWGVFVSFLGCFFGSLTSPGGAAGARRRAGRGR